MEMFTRSRNATALSTKIQKMSSQRTREVGGLVMDASVVTEKAESRMKLENCWCGGGVVFSPWRNRTRDAASNDNDNDNDNDKNCLCGCVCDLCGHSLAVAGRCPA